MLESDLITLKGSHGTKESSAKVILVEGFNCNKYDRESLWGKGAYFWTNRGDCHDLAIDWFKYRWKDYLTTEKCYVLCAEISLERDCFLDFGDTGIQRAFLQLKKHLAKTLGKQIDNLTNKECQKLKKIFLDACDKKNGKKHTVIKAPVPQDFRKRHMNMELGWPYAYIIRDLKCIVKVSDNRDARNCVSC